jgi:hypothetical protein
VIDGVVGDFLCEKYGSLAPLPLTLRVKDNRLVEAHSENKELENDFWKYTHTDANSDRVGEFAIGTNIELKEVIGHISKDEKFPGIMSPSAIRTASTPAPIEVDDAHRRGGDALQHLGRCRQIMADGRFLIE